MPIINTNLEFQLGLELLGRTKKIKYVFIDSILKSYDGVFYNPEVKYEFKHNKPPKPRCLKIYEVHIGMAGIEPRVHTFKEFT